MSHNKKSFSVEKADWELDKDALRHIRHSVFVIEQQVPIEEEWDEHDLSATHYLLYEHTEKNKRPIATARLLNTGQIGRMAVLKDSRRQGIGGMLLEFILTSKEAKQHQVLFLNAQVSAIAFYESLGFTLTQADAFEEAGIMHRTMEFQYD